MDVPISKDRKFVCVEYPGIVKNECKMLDTLGGESNISKVFSTSSKRLELRFRPGDVYSKPSCADRHSTTHLLMRVRRKNRKPDDMEKSTANQHEDLNPPTAANDLDAEILGVVDTTYKFNSMADFQYLPMDKNSDGTYKQRMDDLVLSNFEHSSWLKKEASLFLPPPIFSRIDKPVGYLYRDPPKHRKVVETQNKTTSDNMISVDRQRRPHYTKFWKFDEEVPMGPDPDGVRNLQPKVRDAQQEKQLKELFEARPIWSRSAINCHTNISRAKLKIMLPLVAYIAASGPWRNLYIRFGYDPRKCPEAKLYQVVDFRVRDKPGLESLGVKAKRSTYIYNLPNTVAKVSNPVPQIQTEDIHPDRPTGATPQEPTLHNELTYVFKPGLLPAHRQMFYQLCDIHDPEVQRVVHVNDGEEEECTEKDGWCVKDYQEKCRELIAGHVNPLIQAEKLVVHSKGKSSAKHPAKSSRNTVTSLPSDDSQSDMETEMSEYL